MPKRNYGYEKRQKELHKQQKREDKLKRKLERADVPADEPAARRERVAAAGRVTSVGAHPAAFAIRGAAG